jgi:predicted molibdopterin-dependent oxidoreductase YjgC
VLEEAKAAQAPKAESQTRTNTNTDLGGGLRLLTYRLLYDDGSRIRDTAGLRELTLGAFVELNPADAERAGVTDGQSVRVSSAHGSLTTHAQISKGIREGVAFVPWSQWGTSAQVLVSWDDQNPSVTVEPAGGLGGSPPEVNS